MSLKLEASEPWLLPCSLTVLPTKGPYRLCDCPAAMRGERVGGLDDLLGDMWRLIGEWGCESGGGEGISGMEPWGELALDILWLVLLEWASRRGLPRLDPGEAIPIRPRLTPLPLLPALTRPSASLVIIL